VTGVLPLLLPFIGTVAGVAATFVLTRRRSSGRIDTSEAADLWAASEAIRRDLTEEIKGLRAEVAALRAENVKLNGEVRSLRLRMMGERGE
jgi:hypothetical protein